MSFQEGANKGINRHSCFLCHISHIHPKVGGSDNMRFNSSQVKSLGRDRNRAINFSFELMYLSDEDLEGAGGVGDEIDARSKVLVEELLSSHIVDHCAFRSHHTTNTSTDQG